MAQLNKVYLIGRLTKDPELRYTPSGIATGKFTLAIDRSFKKDEENATDFLNIVVWRNIAENVSKFLQKGSLAMVEGRIQVRSYEDNAGQRKWITEIVGNNVQFLDRIKSNNDSFSAPDSDVPPPAEEEDDLPF